RCTPDASASCDGGVAVSCPAGWLESIDCTRLLGVAGACTGGEPNPPFDWTAPCAATSPSPPCPGDSCDGSKLTSCERGAAFSVDCAEQGWGSCRLMSVEPGAPMRGACTDRD